MKAVLLAAALALSACAQIGQGVDALGLDPSEPAAESTTPEASDGASAAIEPEGTPVPFPPPRGQSAVEFPPAALGPEEEAVAELPPPEPAQGGDAVPDGSAPRASVADVPHVYMAVQPDRGGPISVVFAIDRSRDGTPSDDPAIRITPEQTDPDRGQCNPQQLRYFNFPQGTAERPIYGPEEASRGVGPKDLPGFMATAVSQEMIVRGMADELEQTRPQNVCTRKLFEQTIIAASTGQG